MEKIGTKKKKSSSKKNSMKELTILVNRLSESSQSQNEQVVRELASMRQDMLNMRTELSRRNKETGRSFRAPRLFGRSRSQPAPEPVLAPSKPSINIEDLLPLLPNLGNVIPQLSNPKVADAIKMLSNPAVMSMIQQVLQGNSGLLKRNANILPQSQRGRALL